MEGEIVRCKIRADLWVAKTFQAKNPKVSGV
jgi:hypothetical protein